MPYAVCEERGSGKGRRVLSPPSANSKPRARLSAPALLWQYGDMLDKERSREVRQNIRRVLMAEWDPIGVSDIPEAADEYDSYIGGVYELLEGGASEGDIGAYLREIEVERLEMVDSSRQPLLPEARRNTVASSLKKLGRCFPETR